MKSHVDDLVESRKKAQKQLNVFEFRYAALADEYRAVQADTKTPNEQANQQRLVSERFLSKAHDCENNVNMFREAYTACIREVTRKNRKLEAHKHIDFAGQPSLFVDQQHYTCDSW